MSNYLELTKRTRFPFYPVSPRVVYTPVNSGSLFVCGSLDKLAAGYKSSPVKLGGDTDWSRIVVGGGVDYANAIKRDGTLWAWGLNTYGNVPDGTITTRTSPVQIGDFTTWTSLSAPCAGYCSHAVQSDGTLWAWGFGGYGMLGLSNLNHYSSPVKVGSLTDWSKTSGNMASGYNALIMIKSDGRLRFECP